MDDLILEPGYDDDFGNDSWKFIDYILASILAINSYTIIDKFEYIGSFQSGYDEYDRRIYSIIIVTEGIFVEITFNKRDDSFIIEQYHSSMIKDGKFPIKEEDKMSNAEVFKYLIIYIHHSMEQIIIPSFALEDITLIELYERHIYVNKNP